MKPRTLVHVLAVGVALVAALLPFYVELAVGIIDPPGGPGLTIQLAVLTVGVIGALIARFEPAGMARALTATAVAQALTAVISYMIEPRHPASPLLEVLGVHAMFIALFLGSAWLFRWAAREPRAGCMERVG